MKKVLFFDRTELCDTNVETKINLRDKNIECSECDLTRGGCRTAATSKMEHFVIIVNGLTIITKSSISDITAVLDPPLLSLCLPFNA